MHPFASSHIASLCRLLREGAQNPALLHFHSIHNAASPSQPYATIQKKGTATLFQNTCAIQKKAQRASRERFSNSPFFIYRSAASGSSPERYTKEKGASPYPSARRETQRNERRIHTRHHSHKLSQFSQLKRVAFYVPTYFALSILHQSHRQETFSADKD